MVERGSGERAATALVSTILVLAVLILASVVFGQPLSSSSQSTAGVPSRKMNAVASVSSAAGGFLIATRSGRYANSCSRTKPDGGESCPAVVQHGAIASSGTVGTSFDYVLIILMENRAICDIMTSCGGRADFMTGLADVNGLATSYVECSDRSLPNYLCLTGGSHFGCTGYDGLPRSNSCTNLTWVAPNIVDRLVGANLTWKAYMEDMPTNCYGANNGTYLVRHDPFVYYGDIVDNATRCDRVIPAGTADETLLHDLNSTSNASNYMWLTPNRCNDMHDCGVPVGDTYLEGLIPQVLNSMVFKTQRAALFITFDEDSDGNGAPSMYTVWAGPTAKANYTSAAAYNHSSLLATLEANWALPPLTANDSNAASMDEFFVGSPAPPGSPTPRFTASPAWPRLNETVIFNASASSDPNPNATLQFRWDWENDGTWDTPWSTSPTTFHAFSPPGIYTVVLQVKDSLGHVDDKYQEVAVDGLPPVTDAFVNGPRGLNGWYTGNVTVTLTPTDDLSGVANTNYSFDGGAWETYLGPLNVAADGTHVFRYYSVDHAGNVEATKIAQVDKDGTPPVTSATFAGTVNGNTFLTPINVTLHASDIGSGLALTEYRVDGGAWTNYTATFGVNETGTHTVRYHSADIAGNAEVTNAFDVANGSVSGVAGLSSTAYFLGTPGSIGWYTSTVHITFNLTIGTTPPDSIWYRIDGGRWKPYALPLTVNQDGIHDLEYYATNGAGLDEVIHHDIIRIDTAAPATSNNLSGVLGDNGWYLSNVTVRLNASDTGSGVQSIQYRVDGGAWVVYNAPFLLSSGGRHSLEFDSVDVAGNLETADKVPVDIEDSTPAVVFLTPAANATTTSPVSIAWKNADNDSGIRGYLLSVDGSPFAPIGNASHVTMNLSVGSHVIRVSATDLAGLATVETLTIRVSSVLPGPPGPGAPPVTGPPLFASALVILVVLPGVSIAAVAAYILWTVRRARKPR